MDKPRVKPWRLISAKQTDKAVTRDGREVLRWRVISDPKVTLWATEVTVKDPEDKRKKLTYIVNHNGRRYANIQSADDIYKLLPPKPMPEHDNRPDVMPDVLRAIEAAKNHDVERIRLANKYSPYEHRRGCTSDRFMIIDNSE